MAILTHTLGYPRVGANRELKFALENYWAGKIPQEELENVGKNLRHLHWQKQKENGIDFVPVGDFAWYDQVLQTSLLLGNIPARHRQDLPINLDTLFRVARGKAPTGRPTAASEMSKWFNTNYHYIVPEFTQNQTFELSWFQLFDEIQEAQALSLNVKPVLIGPLTYLWLGKTKGADFDKLSLLPQLLQAYQDILNRLQTLNLTWIQIDEPILSLDLPSAWQTAFIKSYQSLQKDHLKILLATYFGSVDHQSQWLSQLEIDCIHLDCSAVSCDIATTLQKYPAHWQKSLGVVNGRNIWRTHLAQRFEQLNALDQTADLWLAPSCSLLHVPYDLNAETKLDAEARSWFAFAEQKCLELHLLKQALHLQDEQQIRILNAYSQPLDARQHSSRVHSANVQHTLKTLNEDQIHQRAPFTERQQIQREAFDLPLFPTTTIGSFPQTAEIRGLRRQLKQQHINEQEYQQAIHQQIEYAVRQQEEIGLDVLVHGEAERNDMVEYFGEQLTGYLFTEKAWVQSYGSRCVKPPIIVGDIDRPHPMTTEWTRYAQSLTTKQLKGMLTGPITMLCWSFPREDVSRQTMAYQLGLAIQKEVLDLEKQGIQIIQIDEPALREGLPLRESEQGIYLDWAVKAFQLTTSGVADSTQIHTHMCYCDFNDIMPAITALDADVITLETSRSDMELLEAFQEHGYPNEIGPGVYDIHSPNVPDIDWMTDLIRKATQFIPADRIWINPDCGLKTRAWPETKAALKNMVKSAEKLRHEFA